MASISSLGVGSGLDIGGLVSQLVAAEGDAKTARYDRKETLLQTQISAIGTVKSVLAEFQSVTSELTTAGDFLGSIAATSSNESIFTATADSTAVEGSYVLEVTKLAAAQSIASNAADAVADVTDVIGTGTLTFEFGTYSGGAFTANPDKTTQNVTITDGSLAGIRNAINAANIGVDASIVNDGNGYRLVMTSESGAANSMRITATDDDSINNDQSGLSKLTYDGTAAANSPGNYMEETVAASDAQFFVDGLSVSSATNTVTSVIDGVTIDLQKAEVNTLATLTVAKETGDISTKVSDFVEGFNLVYDTIKALTYYNSESDDAGIMIGDATLRGIDSSLRRVMGQVIGDSTESYNSLASLGISTERDGTLSFDATKLNAALAEDPDRIAAIFAGGDLSKSSTDSLNFKYDFTNIPNTAPEKNSAFINLSITQEPTHGKYEGGAISTSFPKTITGTGYNFSIAVDGGAAVNVSLASGSTFSSASILAAHFESKINSALSAAGQAGLAGVSYNSTSGGFDVRSEAWGAPSSIEFTSMSNLMISEFGFDASGPYTGLDIAGSVDGETATGSGNVLTVDPGPILTPNNYAGMNVAYNEDRVASSVTTTSLSGVMNQLDDLMNSYLSSDGVLQAKTNSYNAQIDSINNDREALARRLASLEQRFISQFSAMDSMVAQLNATGDYMSQQIQSLANLNKKS